MITTSPRVTFGMCQHFPLAISRIDQSYSSTYQAIFVHPVHIAAYPLSITRNSRMLNAFVQKTVLKCLPSLSPMIIFPGMDMKTLHNHLLSTFRA